MARTRSPNRDKAYQLWIESGKKKKLKDIAEDLQVSESQVRKWKNQDHWEGEKEKVTLPNSNGNVTIQKKHQKEDIDETVENDELTARQQLFCLLYAKNCNATKSYMKAYECSYESALAAGPRLLGNVRIKEEIKRLKKERFENQLFDEHDIFQWYLDVATASITDFVKFGRKEVQAMGAFGPITDKKTGKPIMKEVNYVDFRESDQVDGRVIKKVKMGKDGASLELYDAMQAMQWLSEHMSLGTGGQQSLAQTIVSAWEGRMTTQGKDGGDDAGR